MVHASDNEQAKRDLPTLPYSERTGPSEQAQVTAEDPTLRATSHSDAPQLGAAPRGRPKQTSQRLAH